jgi:uncharacterized protein YodC (DUF2158 family)
MVGVAVCHKYEISGYVTHPDFRCQWITRDEGVEKDVFSPDLHAETGMSVISQFHIGSYVFESAKNTGMFQ